MAAETAKTFRMAGDAIKTQVELAHPGFATEITAFINDSLPINGKQEYTAFLAGVTAIIAEHSAELTVPNPLFERQMKLLENDELNLVISDWGGVMPQFVDMANERREKYLVIRQAVRPSGVLGDPEFHKLKDEHLEVKEGFVILVGAEPDAWEAGDVTLRFAGPGDTCTLHPGNRHGIIALTNAVILEKANNTLKNDILSAWDATF
jgi:hypothetical protein